MMNLVLHVTDNLSFRLPKILQYFCNLGNVIRRYLRAIVARVTYKNESNSRFVGFVIFWPFTEYFQIYDAYLEW